MVARRVSCALGNFGPRVVTSIPTYFPVLKIRPYHEYNSATQSYTETHSTFDIFALPARQAARDEVNDYDRKSIEFRTYSCLYHGVGLADEYPCIYFPSAWDEAGYAGQLEPGMVICVESYLGRHAGGPGVKLEEQVLSTETGCELLSSYPIKEILTNN